MSLSLQIKQISTHAIDEELIRIVALCADGSVWMLSPEHDGEQYTGEWLELPPITRT